MKNNFIYKSLCLYLCKDFFMYKGIIIYLSILSGLLLLICGSYITIENYFEPQGLLFEGIMATGLGIAILMIVLVASTIGKTIIVFGDILSQTAELNKVMTEQAKQSRPGFTDLLYGMMPPGSTFSVTDINTGKTRSAPIDENSEDALEKINKLMQETFENRVKSNVEKNDSLNLLTNKELENRLLIAIKEDDFEKASEINKILKERLDNDNKSEE